MSSNTVVDAAPQDQEAQTEPDLREYGILSFKDIEERAAIKQPYIVERLLLEESVAILVGNSGVGKTPLAVALGVAIASGTPFLGRKVISSGRVLYCDAEGTLFQFQQMLASLSRAAGLAEPPTRFRLWSPNFLPPERGDWVRHLVKSVELYRPKVVIVDTYRMFWPRAEGDSGDTANLLKALRQITKKVGCSWILIHHLRKEDFDRQVSLEDTTLMWFKEAAGSSALVNHTDTRLGLEEERDDLIFAGFIRVDGLIPALQLQRI